MQRAADELASMDDHYTQRHATSLVADVRSRLWSASSYGKNQAILEGHEWPPTICGKPDTSPDSEHVCGMSRGHVGPCGDRLEHVPPLSAT